MIDAPLMSLGITGTDTGIGKTVVTVALAARARELGIRVAAMKPVETGLAALTVSHGALPRSDAERIADAVGEGDLLSLVRPFALDEPLAPMVAAERAGVNIDIEALNDARAALTRDRSLLLVEGAGGLLVPISRTLSFAQLFSLWRCELVIVAGNRLGVLNHVLLTVRAAQVEQLPVRGIVLTSLSSSDPTVAEATNYDALVALLPDVQIYRLPWIDRIDDPYALAAAAAASGLDSLLLRAQTVPSHVPDTIDFD